MERILLAGEDPAQRQMIGRTLEVAGYEVVACDNARDTVLAVMQSSVDLVLVNTPLRYGSSVIALLRWIRSRRASTQVACMVMVGADESQLVGGLYDAGADFVITRRTQLDLLPRKVAAALARRSPVLGPDMISSTATGASDESSGRCRS